MTTVKTLHDMITLYESIHGERPAVVLMGKSVFNKLTDELEWALSAQNEPSDKEGVQFHGIPVKVNDAISFIELK